MMEGRRRTHRVLQAVLDMLAEREDAGGDPSEGFAPQDVNARLRADGDPMGAWEVRGELAALEAAGELRFEPVRARWYLAQPLRRSA